MTFTKKQLLNREKLINFLLTKGNTYFKVTKHNREQIGLTTGRLTDAVRCLKKEGVLIPRKQRPNRSVYLIDWTALIFFQNENE